MNKLIHIIGYGSDMAGANRGSGKGADVLKNSVIFNALAQHGLLLKWQKLLYPDLSAETILLMVSLLNKELAKIIKQTVYENKFFTVIGGDHSSAIGTWSGASQAKSDEGQIGLIWVDAHLDSHTPLTSETGNIHGMPLACLLGYGDPSLSVMGQHASLFPQNVCIIGARSYEDPELALLESLKVKIYFMDEINTRGMGSIMKEAISLVSKNTCAYGITIDIDSVDPLDAPGTGVAAEGGIRGDDLCQSLTTLCDDPRLIGCEIVEFDPQRDKDKLTEKLVTNMLACITLGRVI